MPYLIGSKNLNLIIMTVFNPIWFRADLSKTAVMDFIARTAPEHYYLIPAGGSTYYGMFISEDVVEYFINEFTVSNLDIVTQIEVKRMLSQPGCKIWGSKDLTHF